MFWLTGKIGIDLYDEGYLWYGAIRTMAGEVPVRDFQSYDPGRYYWSAAWSQVFGSGILSLRLSNSIFQILGLTAGLLAARRITTRPIELLAIGVVLLLWMFPRHKLFEPSLVMMNIYVVTRLLERPDARRHFMAGLMLGIAATFGRNHGLYGTLGQLAMLTLVYLHARPARPAFHLLCWGCGIVAGYTPVLGLMLGAPGFAPEFYQSLFEFGPMPRPVPWPWRILSAPVTPLLPFLVTWAVSLAYVAMAIGYPLVLLAALRDGFGRHHRRALLYACACVGAGYAHHAFNRAGLSHFAQAVHPLILGSIALPAAVPWFDLGRRRVAVWGCVILLSTVVATSMHGMSLQLYSQSQNGFARHHVAGDELWLPNRMAEDLAGVERAVRLHVREDEVLFIIPYRATYYPLLGRESPVWGIFFLRAEQGETDEEIIRSLQDQGVDWVLYNEERIVGTSSTFPELRPQVWAYLQEHFAPIFDPNLPRRHSLLRREK
ncbi:MAG: hypothetical protein QF570_15680 [Myxococcota bacterium]|jgi:hypothetical protein|nr:hypothetical protein [Myxococcota bacterium]